MYGAVSFARTNLVTGNWNDITSLAATEAVIIGVDAAVVPYSSFTHGPPGGVAVSTGFGTAHSNMSVQVKPVHIVSTGCMFTAVPMVS